MPDDTKSEKGIPAWQRTADTTVNEGSAAAQDVSAEAPEEVTEEMLEVAREFLKDDAVKDSPREDKVEFLQSKGIPAETIEKLLAEDTGSSELKTVHDSTKSTTEASRPEPRSESTTAQTVISQPSPPQRDLAPVITYPEFLLKPQKPPPLITVSRLVGAAYALAGVSLVTWGASNYLIDPMLETLTDARHDFADTTREDLEKLNEKLETMVSHVPYIASSAAKKIEEDDLESVDSDPTEFFHRDIATQTTPGLSRSSSVSSHHTLDPTISQAQRLSGLAYSLKDLAVNIDNTTKNEQKLKATVEDFQKKIDAMDASYSLLKNEYYSSSSIYSANNEAKKNAPRENESQKFKAEIRALKGAFLSSRNFPTAPRPAASAGTR